MESQPPLDTVTQTLTEQKTIEEPPEILKMRLKPEARVTWGAEVIDNEHMGKKSSKRKFRVPSFVYKIPLHIYINRAIDISAYNYDM